MQTLADICICMHVYTRIPNLLSQFNVVCMYMSIDDYFALDNLY